MPSKQEIERMAYVLWEQDGRPEGRDQHYYYEAERQLREQEGKRVSQAASPVSMSSAKTIDGMGASKTTAESKTRRRIRS